MGLQSSVCNTLCNTLCQCVSLLQICVQLEAEAAGREVLDQVHVAIKGKLDSEVRKQTQRLHKFRFLAG